MCGAPQTQTGIHIEEIGLEWSCFCCIFPPSGHNGKKRCFDARAGTSLLLVSFTFACPFFFFYSFYPAPEPSQHSSGVSAPFRPPASSPAHVCICTAEASVSQLCMQHAVFTTMRRCAALGVRPKVNIKPEPTFPQLSHQHWMA